MKILMLGFKSRRVVIALSLVLLAGMAGAFLRPGKSQTTYQTAASRTPPGNFKPTEAQWNALKIEAVETRSFRTEQVTEGNIALDDDLNTPVFSPYSRRVTRLIAKLGDRVERGAQAARFADTAALFQALGGGWWNRPEVISASAGFSR